MGEGDSAVSVFESASGAVRAAIDATRALAEVTWPDGASLKARFGLHTGEAKKRGGIHYGPAEAYYGTTLNLAARVRAEAAGGEVLLSETSASLVRATFRRDTRLIDLDAQPEGDREAGDDQGACGARSDDHTGRRRVPVSRPAGVRSGRSPSLLRSRAGGSRASGPHQYRPAAGGRRRLGSGKSSLLRAGVLAAVRAGEAPIAVAARLITPGAEPPLDLDGSDTELLIVDQFEELYTQCHDVERRARFIRALLARRGPVVIGVRADFYGEMSAHAAPPTPSLTTRSCSSRCETTTCDVRSPNRPDSPDSGKPGLIDLVLRDVAGEPGALPLMSHALQETWERRDGRTLTVDAYQESGGVSSAVAQTADAVVGETPEQDRPLLRDIFLRLTEIGDDT